MSSCVPRGYAPQIVSEESPSLLKLEQYESGELQKLLAASAEEAAAMPAPEVQAKQQELKDAAARGDMDAVLTLTNELLELEGAPEGQAMGGGGTNIVGGAA